MDNRTWYKNQIRKYRGEFPSYRLYADVLKRILEAACAEKAPLAIVQTRPKSLSSFAEKITRKSQYNDPATQFTDLCGARVITNTLDEAELICKFIRDHFVIDETNSLDAISRLQPTQFGYRSFHYIVQVDKPRILDIDIPAKIGERKAEIQVRTLLQHAWSDVTHNLIYKSRFAVPDQWKRDLHRVAALLEEGDAVFSNVIEKLKSYKTFYSTYMDKNRMSEEIQTLSFILENEPSPPNKPGIALQIARISKAACDWGGIIRILGPYASAACCCIEKSEILMEHGLALCRVHRKEPNHPKYKKGQEELERAAGSSDEAVRIQALSYLAWSYGNDPGHEAEARKLYKEVFELDPFDPYHMVSYIEFEIFCTRSRHFVPYMRHSIYSAIRTCHSHAEAGIQLPLAFFTIGKLHLLLNEPYESLNAYATALHLCLTDDSCLPPDAIEEQLGFLKRIRLVQDRPPEYSWVEDLFLLAEAAKNPKGRAMKEIRKRATRDMILSSPVVIIAGGTDSSVEARMSKYHDHLENALDGFAGTVISGGTTAGIPGIIGNLSKHFSRKIGPRLQTIGYLPRKLPLRVNPHKGYSRIIEMDGVDFTPLQPMQNWIDILAAGIQPSHVRLLGINGGQLAEFEYRLALALGSIVGIVESSGRAASKLMSEVKWLDSGHLLWLPLDRMTLRAFINPGKTELCEEQLDRVGEAIHGEFLKENRHKTDPVMFPWAELREDFKKDNINQAACASEILRRQGYGLRKTEKHGKPIVLPVKDIEAMAEMEHGRWVVERLRSGWKYAKQRDTAKKMSPYLIGWKELPENARKWDRDTVKNWPRLLMNVGLEVIRKK
jgi:ppGpp synthetase/RelA/SpoT-type nucleotidyltranferase